VPLTLKNPQVEALAVEVAELAGESKTEAVRKGPPQNASSVYGWREVALSGGIWGDSSRPTYGLQSLPMFLAAKSPKKRLKITSVLDPAEFEASPRFLRVIGVILREPGWEILRDRMESAEGTAINAATPAGNASGVYQVELEETPCRFLDAFTLELGVQVIPFTESHWRLAAEAFLRYGKGRHPAALNFGDCIVYATARSTRMPLLFKGRDFELTDVAR